MNISSHVLVKIFPFLNWFKGYSGGTFRDDLIAGLTVGVVAIPQSMAYAMIAGLPPIFGLYSAMICTFISALWGSLGQLSTGPVAITSLLVVTALSPLAKPGSVEFINMACTLSLLIGGFYLCFGFLKLGKLMNFISHSSIKGFTSAAAVIIATTQLPNLFGISVERQDNVISTLIAVLSKLSQTNLATLMVGIIAYVVIYVTKRLNPHLPAGLLGLLVAGGTVAALGLDQYGVETLAKVTGGLPAFKIPQFDPRTLVNLSGPAIVIALVSFAETYSVSKSIAAATKQKTNIDQELIGQGLANSIGSFFQCYPVSGSFSRTALNFSSGARTGIASGISSFVVVLTLLFFTPLLQYVPKTALAVLVINAVIVLFHPKEIFVLYRKSRYDGIVAMTVFCMGLLIKPDYALLLGIILSLIFYLWKTMHPKIIRVSRDESLQIFVNADKHNKPSCPQILLLQIESEIYFGNAEYTMGCIKDLVSDSKTPLMYLIIDFQSVTCIDITGIDELQTLLGELREVAVEVAFVNLNDEVQDQFSRSGVTAQVGAEYFFNSKGGAIKALFFRLDHLYCRDQCRYSVFNECTSVKQPPSV